jgi:hypothetical protein
MTRFRGKSCPCAATNKAQGTRHHQGRGTKGGKGVMDWCHRNSDGIGIIRVNESSNLAIITIQQIRHRASSQLFESTSASFRRICKIDRDTGDSGAARLTRMMISR